MKRIMALLKKKLFRIFMYNLFHECLSVIILHKPPTFYCRFNEYLLVS